MFFNKKPWLSSASLMLSLFLASCSLRVNEPPQKEMELKLAANETQCLENYDRVLGDYFNGIGPSHEIGDLMDCASRSLELFVKHVRGRDAELYYPKELKKFLEKYFMGKQKIPEGLMYEGMILKQAVLGGETQVLSASELLKTRKLLALFKKHLLLIQPYMPLTKEHLLTLNPSEVDRLTEVFGQMGDELGRFIQETGQDYAFVNFEQLLIEFEKVFINNKVGVGPRTVREYLPVLRAAKSMIAAPPEDKIKTGEWQTLLGTSSRGFAAYLRAWDVVSRHESFFYGEGRERLFALFIDAKKLIDESIRLHPGHVVSFTEMDNILDALGDKGYVPFGATKASVIKIAKIPLIRGLLGGAEKNAQGRDADGLTLGAVSRVAHQIMLINEGQKYFEGLFQYYGYRPGELTMGLTRDQILNVDSRKAWEWTSQISGVSDVAIAQMRDLIKKFEPFYNNDGVRMYFGLYPGHRYFTFEGLTTFNWLRSYLNFMVTGYAQDLSRAQKSKGLLIHEWDKIFRDFRIYGNDVKFFDPRYDDSARKRHREMNLFATTANGDQILDLYEGMELLAFMISAKNMGNTIHSEMVDLCRTGELDVFGKPKIEPRCYRKTMNENFKIFWSNMPGMVEFFCSQPLDGRQKFLWDVERAGRRVKDLNLWIESGDTEAYAMIFHYIEAIYRRHDTNSSGLSKDALDYDEVKAAFPVLKPTLQEIVKQKSGKEQSDDILFNILVYILKEKKEPETGSILKDIKFWLWMQTADKTFYADRGTIVSIIALLANTEAQ